RLLGASVERAEEVAIATIEGLERRERLEVRLDPAGARLGREEALAAPVLEERVLGGVARDERVRERRQRAAVVEDVEEVPHEVEPPEGDRLVVARLLLGRGRRDVVALDRGAERADRLAGAVAPGVDEGDEEVGRVRPLLAGERRVLEAADERGERGRRRVGGRGGGALLVTARAEDADLRDGARLGRGLGAAHDRGDGRARGGRALRGGVIELEAHVL